MYMKSKGIIRKTTFALKLGDLYKDIISINLDENDTILTAMNKFYEVMRFWGICHGNYVESGGIQMAAGEWNACLCIFKSYNLAKFNMWLLRQELPEDLQAYYAETVFQNITKI